MNYTLHLCEWIGLSAGLVVLAYLDRLYRELSRAAVSPYRENLEDFEEHTEPKLHFSRRRAGICFSILVRLWLALTAVALAHDVFHVNAERGEMAVGLLFLLGGEVVVGMHFFPALLMVRTRGRWIRPLAPLLRILLWLTAPVEALLHFFVNLLRLGDEDETESQPADQEAIEALVEKATEEGIIEHDDARLIEQVVEFGDTHASEVMTPRPDIVAIRAEASLEDLRRLLLENRYSRIPVFDTDLDDIIGIAFAQDILHFPEREAAQHTVRELVRPVLFVPETKLGSELLKEMQRKNQQLAICVNEYGSTAGIVTAEDLIEEIVGEIGDEHRPPAPNLVREVSGAVILRGSLPIGQLQELFGAGLHETLVQDGATTVAGLLNRVAGHVPATGEKIEYEGLAFEILEANQRKVLRVRVRQTAAKKAEPKAAS